MFFPFKPHHCLLGLLLCGGLYELWYDTLHTGIRKHVGNAVGWNTEDVNKDTALSLGDLLNSHAASNGGGGGGDRASESFAPRPSASTAAAGSASVRDADITCSTEHLELLEFTKRFRLMDSPYAEAGITAKPGYFTPCYRLPWSNMRYGLRGWRCSKTGKQNEGGHGSCLLNASWIKKDYDGRRFSGTMWKHDGGNPLQSGAPHHPQDVPCEAAQKADPSCKCPAWREPEENQTLRKWETSLAFSKTDSKFYPGYYRPNAASIWDVDSADPEPADSPTRKACDETIQSTLPAAIKALLAKGDWGEVLQVAKKDGFVETFLHTRAPNILTRPKERFDWVLGGGGEAACPLRGLVDSPRTVLMPLPWDNRGGNMHILGYALTTHSDMYTSLLNYDVEPGADGGGMPEWKPGDPFRVLVIAGSDYRVAERLRWMNALLYQRYFHRILWEANNRKFPGVHTAPIGFNFKYTTMHGSDTILKILLNPVPLAKKNTSFLAAWGAVYSKLDATIPSRKTLIKWLDKTKIGKRQTVKAHSWWPTLSKYRFQLCPTGNGVQAPKVQESWMSNVIPIVQNEPAFVELKKWGYPIVVLEKWEEITEEKMEQWWQELSPQLAVVKWMLLPDVWYAFVTQPCPITNIVDFLRRAGINEDVFPKP